MTRNPRSVPGGAPPALEHPTLDLGVWGAPKVDEVPKNPGRDRSVIHRRDLVDEDSRRHRRHGDLGSDGECTELRVAEPVAEEREAQPLTARTVDAHGCRGAAAVDAREIDPGGEVDDCMHRRIEAAAGFEQHALGIDEGDAVAHARGQVAQQVGQALGGILDRLGDLSHVAQCERVARLEKVPAGLRERHGPVDVQQREPEACGERSGSRTESIGLRHGEGEESAVTRAAHEGILLPRSAGRRRDEDRQPARALCGQFPFSRLDTHLGPLRVVGPDDHAQAAVRRMGEEGAQAQRLVHAAPSRSGIP